jgi:hypothetical protein
MLDLAKVTRNDFVIDLGSGDGVIVISAANRGSKAHGIEYNPDLVELSQRNAAAAGVNDNATFEEADLFESDFSKATVITMFLLPSLNLRLRPKLLDLKPGTRIVSNTYDMGDWKPDKTVIVPECATAELRSGIFRVEVVRGSSLDRACQGRGLMETSARRTHTRAAVSDGFGCVGIRRQRGADHTWQGAGRSAQFYRRRC